MKYSLAVAALVGAVSASDIDAVNVQMMEKIVAGALQGALHAEGFDDISACIKDAAGLVATAEKAVKDFEKNSIDGTIDGLTDVATLLKEVKNGMADCTKTKADWARLESMVSIFESPMSFTYHVGKDLLLNGVEIYGEINAGINDYKIGAWQDFGYQMGAATAKVILGSEQMEAEIAEQKRIVDLAKVHDIVKGTLEGALEQEHLTDIEKCIVDSDKVLLLAEKTYEDFSRSSIRGINDGVKDISDMLAAIENDMQDCSSTQADWTKLKNMISIFKHPLSLAYHIGKDLLLNGVDIYKNVNGAIADYQGQRWESFGKHVGAATAETLIGMERQAMDLLVEQLEADNTEAIETMGYLF